MINGTWYLSYHTWYYYCCMFNRTHSAARHNTAKRRARHGTALCCAALLSYIDYSRADRSWGCVVIQQRSMYKLINSTGTWDDTANACYWHVRTNKSTAKHAARQSSKARQSTQLRSAKLELQGIAGHCTALRCCEL